MEDEPQLIAVGGELNGEDLESQADDGGQAVGEDDIAVALVGIENHLAEIEEVGAKRAEEQDEDRREGVGDRDVGRGENKRD